MSRDKRTYQDRKEYIKAAVTKRRITIKKKSIEHMGGECQVCGYKKYYGALEFHHIDPSTKAFAISSYGHSRSWVRVVDELSKCVLLCANCHREVSAGLIKLDTSFTQEG